MMPICINPLDNNLGHVSLVRRNEFMTVAASEPQSRVTNTARVARVRAHTESHSLPHAAKQLSIT